MAHFARSHFEHIPIVPVGTSALRFRPSATVPLAPRSCGWSGAGPLGRDESQQQDRRASGIKEPSRGRRPRYRWGLHAIARQSRALTSAFVSRGGHSRLAAKATGASSDRAPCSRGFGRTLLRGLGSGCARGRRCLVCGRLHGVARGPQLRRSSQSALRSWRPAGYCRGHEEQRSLCAQSPRGHLRDASDGRAVRSRGRGLCRGPD